jgi:hypothetical protein
LTKNYVNIGTKILKEIKMKKIIFAIILIVFSSISLYSKQDTITISLTFGKWHFYSVQSSETFLWDGNLKIENGELLSIYKLTYSKWNGERFGPSLEYSKQLTAPEWKTEIPTHSGEGMEGIRFTFIGDASSHVILNFNPITIEFPMSELFEKEYLEYHVGGKYSGQPVAIFLGPDARYRITRKIYLSMLEKENRAGWLMMPDDFNGKKINYHTKYSTVIEPLETVTGAFQIKNFNLLNKDKCDIRVQLMAALKDSTNKYVMTINWNEVEIRIGEYTQKVKQYFTHFRSVERLTDVYFSVPQKFLKESGNIIKIKNLDPKIALMLFRVYINESFPDYKKYLSKLPPLPKYPQVAIGYDANTIAAQSGEIDSLINMEGRDEIGNYILFRPETQHLASKEDYIRYTPMLKKYNIKTALFSTPNSFEDSIFTADLGKNYLGIHRHECSNLIYGWGDPDPLEKRKDRSLPECWDYYMNRMRGTKVLGQALPIMNMDYEAGVNFVFCEPAGHATLLYAASRGDAKAYNKNTWGVHVANHVIINPNDKAMERRQYILINQGWLYGAKVIYDEEAALYAIHDAPHSFSDSLPFNRRKQYQELFHFANNLELGKEIVKYGFLQGLYDCPVGGVQANPYVIRTKFWGMIGPEKSCWTFDTPERGWELLSDYMPGVWLYPVLQDPKDIRFILSSSPHGQVDLLPANGKPEALDKYEMLILPGWNTMTDQVYRNLIQYVKNGGHLVLSAAQCTKHIKRDFLIERKDFNYYNNGDLSELAGIKLGNTGNNLCSAKWFDGKTCDIKGTTSLEVKLNGARTIISDENNNPVLIENKIGKGKVWMLTTGEFWGANSLDQLRKQINSRLIDMHKQEYYITGDIEDIDYHVYRTNDGNLRIVLLNTDWTTAGNIKKINLNYNKFSIPMDIREGRMTQVLINKELAVVSEMPASTVDNLNMKGKNISFTLNGVDDVKIGLVSLNKIKNISIGGESKKISEKIEINMGPKWTTKNCVISF